MRIPSLLPPDSSVAEAPWRPLRRAADQVHAIAATGLDSVAPILKKRDQDCIDADGNSVPCHTSTSDFGTNTLPIILGVVIPVVVALAVLVYLHQRTVKRQRRESLNDPHKSLDFGIDVSRFKKGGKATLPEMTVTDLTGAARGGRGVSMDLGISNPYLLPTRLNGSTDSLHSISRSIQDQHDPYRHVALLARPSTDNSSLRPRDDKASLYSANTSNENARLMSNAMPMSQYLTKGDGSSSPSQSTSAERSMPPSRKSSLSQKPAPEIHLAEIEEADMPGKDLPAPPPEPEILEKDFLPSLPLESEALAEGISPPDATSVGPAPPEKDLLAPKPISNQHRRSSFYGDEDYFGSAEPRGHGDESLFFEDINPDMIDEGQPSHNAPDGLGLHNVHDLAAPPAVSVQRLSVMGMRPLPPDMPDDNPETRANRIRSFYREYFDDSRPNPADAQYDNDLFFDGGAIYDPETGGFVVPGARPFAQPMGRRAMTPPPRGPPRSQRGTPQPHNRKFSTMSMGRPRGRSAPRKNLPPPKPLQGLPTPHSLKSDLEIMNPIDFAPLSSFRPDTPKGSPQPYNPTVRPWTPLQSSFDTLTVMPSPHELRKSTTFTALDFAPPPAIRDMSASNSDAGSMRSNLSGMSAWHRDAVRKGAYRVSRIPKAMVGTREEFASQLRPKMDMINPA